MRASDGHGQAVSGVIGLNNGFHAENQLDHLLNLVFVSPAVRSNRLLYFKGSKFINRQATTHCGSQNNASRFGDLDCRFQIFKKEKFFYGQSVRLITFNNFF
ncbi:MAG: hypothetical protein UV02_C0016G0004 [Candidatus Kuenenbacteria bacterium GW2011_GWA2_42_15]|uniref:Uncharacterized protein n=1 Tax=Candidatus Kuenenbacteria bacterium GW2011_GWA2_42_15 TaxID=1618677 RepID=A0A0G0Z0R0_9BACT|nr:MAG: hypothetical protein UV02_C0016G0004 [Candidatus Kuenenbacteria bacterium GW2011_GWA2_42_15]